MKKKDLQTVHIMHFIKVARQWQLFYLSEMEYHNISETKIKTESGMSDDVLKKFYTGIVQPIKIMQMKNGIKHILKERDLKECQHMGKKSISYPKTEAFLDDIKRMELYMPWDIEEEFIKAASSLDQGNHIKSMIEGMNDLMKQMNFPPFQRKVGKNLAKKTIDQLTHQNA